MVSKQEILAGEILKRVHVHNPDYGGIFSEATGAPGSAKTSVLLSFAKYTIIHFPKEKIFWRSSYDSPLQFFKIGKDNYNIMIKRGSNVVFRDRDKKLAHLDLNHTLFDEFDELYEKAKPGKINAVFFGDRLEWLNYIDWSRGIGEWAHYYIDELGDVAPSFTRGDMWRKVGDFANVLKDVRRCMMNIHTNTQSTKDVDYRVRAKIMLKIFLPGAVVDGTTRVRQRAVDNLMRDPEKGNQAYLDMGGQFGVTRFVDIFKPVSGYHIDAHILTENEIEKLYEKDNT